jgi:hypothetical protein
VLTAGKQLEVIGASEMNRYLPLYPQVVMCLYDIDQFGSGALVNLVMTHPRMLVGGMVIENP